MDFLADFIGFCCSKDGKLEHLKGFFVYDCMVICVSKEI